MVRSSGMKSRLLVLALSACCSATLPGQEPRYEALPDFVVELAAEGIGSLIGCAVLPDGTLLVSVEGSGVRRLRDADGDGRFEEVMAITDELTNVQGMCWHEDHLYLVGQGPDGAGLYRLERGTPRILGRMDGWGEHGPHAVEPGPDGRLYVVIGNHTAFLGEVEPDSPYRIWHEGHLGPRLLDPRGHAVGVAAPGGVILATDAEGEHWSVIAGGFRNPYDLAFHRSGALFTFDSDMEWDIGLPWYRPTRLLHVVPGGEYGWRTGSTKWPVEYPDSMPSALDVGRGSPTGLVRYDGRQFPARFHGALLGGDWAQGRILAFFPRQRDGVGWEAGSEVLLRGRPLNVTDLVVDADGSLLFTVGGRGTRGGVHRLRYGDRTSPLRRRSGPRRGRASMLRRPPGSSSPRCDPTIAVCATRPRGSSSGGTPRPGSTRHCCPAWMARPLRRCSILGAAASCWWPWRGAGSRARSTRVAASCSPPQSSCSSRIRRAKRASP